MSSSSAAVPMSARKFTSGPAAVRNDPERGLQREVRVHVLGPSHGPQLGSLALHALGPRLGLLQAPRGLGGDLLRLAPRNPPPALVAASPVDRGQPLPAA